MKNKENYNPYCKSCSACGENGCCSYLACTFRAIDNNKDCSYPETYKAEIILRDEFFKACFNNQSQSVGIEQFVDNMYDIAYNKAFPERVQTNKNNNNGK
jgi:hypothetical protein